LTTGPSQAPATDAGQPRPDTRLYRGRKTSERLARDIVRVMAQSGLVPGDRLPTEINLAEYYGVSRASLREALRILEAQGLITIRPGPGGGPVLSRSSAREFGRLTSLHLHFARGTIGQLLEARQLMEPVVAAQAARSWDDEGMAEIRAALHDEAAKVSERSFRLDRSSNFHRAVAGAARNAVVALMSEGLAEITRERVSTGALPLDEPSSIHQDHLDIAAAIESRDAAAAHQLMRQHLRRWSRDFVQARQPGYLDEIIGWV
jgi:GntR family transcriptional regulator, transcriptional repressor for pyruvate dehydrogenase complex